MLFARKAPALVPFVDLDSQPLQLDALPRIKGHNAAAMHMFASNYQSDAGWLGRVLRCEQRERAIHRQISGGRGGNSVVIAAHILMRLLAHVLVRLEA